MLLRRGSSGATPGIRSFQEFEKIEGLELKILGGLQEDKGAMGKGKRKASPILKGMESLGQELKEFKEAFKVGNVFPSVNDEGVSPPAG